MVERLFPRRGANAGSGGDFGTCEFRRCFQCFQCSLVVLVTAAERPVVFDAWIATPGRDALTASEVHQAVDYRPITRYDVAGGYSAAALPQVSGILLGKPPPLERGRR